MRVLALTNLYPNVYQPGRAPFNRQQLAALSLRHEVRVIAPIAWTDEWCGKRFRPSPGAPGEGWGEGSAPPAAESGQSLRPGRMAVRDGISVHHPRYLFPPKLLRGWHGAFFLHSVRASFMRTLRAFSPQVILASWAYPDGWAAAELARAAGLPVVIKVHGSDVLLADRHHGRARRTAEALRSADAVVAVSGDLAEHVRQQGVAPTRVHVVYNGIDPDLFRPGSRDDSRTRLGLDQRPIILFVGNLVPVKGPDVLVRACAELRDAGKEFRCVMIGRGTLLAALRSMVSGLGLDDHVALLGDRPLEQLPDWYRAATVLALPSHSEGIPNVILEAQACGTPVVASRVGGVPEVLAPPALVPPGDPAALAQALRPMLRGQRQAAGGRAFGTWRDSADALADVLESTLTARRAAA